MRLARIAVVGGGPGGLYAARLLKLADPQCQVDVYEQSRPDATFGFGVGLAAGTQRNLKAADPDSLADILDRGHRHEMSLRVGDDIASLPGGNLSAIGRSMLLTVLTDRAVEAGVTLHFGERVDPFAVEADLVIAADGVNSATRQARSTAFDVQIDTGAGLYLWCGTDFALPSAVFMPVDTEFGTFVTHAYPYAADRSTFLIETDEQTWQAAGFETSTENTPADESDDVSLRYLEGVFHEALHGHRLIGNRTRWLRFRTVRCGNWHDGNVVLLGDAAHTAHYSIGSGTKLAMEDAITLTAAVQAAPDLPSALSAYEEQRRPAVEHLQAVATRSQRWWDSFPGRTHLPVDRLLVSYMTRAGKVSLPRFAETAPVVVAAALHQYSPDAAEPGGDLVEWVLDQPLHTGDTDYPGRTAAPAGPVETVEVTEPDPWGPKADGLVHRVGDAVAEGAVSVRVTGAADRDAVLDRLDLAERLRLETAAVVSVVAPVEYRVDLAAALVAGRTDLVEWNTPSRTEES